MTENASLIGSRQGAHNLQRASADHGDAAGLKNASGRFQMLRLRPRERIILAESREFPRIDKTLRFLAARIEMELSHASNPLTDFSPSAWLRRAGFLGARRCAGRANRRLKPGVAISDIHAQGQDSGLLLSSALLSTPLLQSSSLPSLLLSPASLSPSLLSPALLVGASADEKPTRQSGDKSALTEEVGPERLQNGSRLMCIPALLENPCYQENIHASH